MSEASRKRNIKKNNAFDELHGGNKTHIPLSRGLHTIVIPEDFEWAQEYSWSAIPRNYIHKHQEQIFYAVRSEAIRKPNGKPSTKQYYLHREIFTRRGEELIKGLEIDHINRDPLDNNFTNLRQVTVKENHKNRDDNVIIDGKYAFEWAEELGISEGTFRARILAGWDKEDILVPKLYRTKINYKGTSLREWSKQEGFNTPNEYKLIYERYMRGIRDHDKLFYKGDLGLLKSIAVYDSEGNEYNSLSQAAKANDVSASAIGHAIKYGYRSNSKYWYKKEAAK